MIRLKRDAGAGLLVTDLVVLCVALSVALDDEAPTVFRWGAFTVAALAVARGTHSVVSIVRRTGRRFG